MQIVRFARKDARGGILHCGRCKRKAERSDGVKVVRRERKTEKAACSAQIARLCCVRMANNRKEKEPRECVRLVHGV